MCNTWLTLALMVLTNGMSAQADTLPLVNHRMVEFLREHMGQQVGRGECWDLAAEALNAAGAKWDGDHGFGRRVDPGREPVFPGDLVQFDRVEFRWQEGTSVHTVRMPHHTAVIIEVISPDQYVIAQQNTRETGRSTGTAELVLSRKVQGKVFFYRPIGLE